MHTSFFKQVQVFSGVDLNIGFYSFIPSFPRRREPRFATVSLAASGDDGFKSQNRVVMKQDNIHKRYVHLTALETGGIFGTIKWLTHFNTQ
jgi:hypothetical protein